MWRETTQDEAGTSGTKIEEGKGPKNAQKMETSLHHISDATGSMKIKEVPKIGDTFTREQLDVSDSYLVDGGTSLYVWLGSKSNKSERREAMAFACKYLASKGRDPSIPIVRLMEGQETPDFWDVFKGKQGAGEGKGDDGGGGGGKSKLKFWKK